MFKPLEEVLVKDEVVTLACFHWKQWPPQAALLGADIEELRNERLVTPNEYNNYLVWQKHCGQTQMSEGACLTCPLVRKLVKLHHNFYLEALDGSSRIKVTDFGQAGAVPRYRVGDRSKNRVGQDFHHYTELEESEDSDD